MELEYDTYESMTYEEQEQVLHKRAIVYLPYGYSEDTQYDVFYLMQRDYIPGNAGTAW